MLRSSVPRKSPKCLNKLNLLIHQSARQSMNENSVSTHFIEFSLHKVNFNSITKHYLVNRMDRSFQRIRLFLERIGIE